MKYQNRTNNDWKFSDKVHQYVLENEIYNHHFFNLKEVTKATKEKIRMKVLITGQYVQMVDILYKKGLESYQNIQKIVLNLL